MSFLYKLYHSFIYEKSRLDNALNSVRLYKILTLKHQEVGSMDWFHGFEPALDLHQEPPGSSAVVASFLSMIAHSKPADLWITITIHRLL